MDPQSTIPSHGNSRQQKHLNTIIDYLHLHLSGDLSARAITSKFEISESSLQRLFKKYTGFTYRGYVEDIRITKAFELIYTEGKSIKQAYYAIGYRNRPTFNHAFKKKYKFSPGQFPGYD